VCFARPASSPHSTDRAVRDPIHHPRWGLAYPIILTSHDAQEFLPVPQPSAWVGAAGCPWTRTPTAQHHLLADRPSTMVRGPAVPPRPLTLGAGIRSAATPSTQPGRFLARPLLFCLIQSPVPNLHRPVFNAARADLREVCPGAPMRVTRSDSRRDPHPRGPPPPPPVHSHSPRRSVEQRSIAGAERSDHSTRPAPHTRQPQRLHKRVRGDQQIGTISPARSRRSVGDATSCPGR